MRVDFTNLGLEPPDKSKPGRAGQTGTADTAGVSGNVSTGTTADRTRFSFDQTRVEALNAQALAAPEVRQAKVEPLQAAVAEGSYTVDSGKVAEAIVAEAGNARIR